jgi:hypothetical protein
LLEFYLYSLGHWSILLAYFFDKKTKTLLFEFKGLTD